MADFPDSIFTPRTVENRDGVSYDDTKTKVFFAEDINYATTEIVAIETILGLNPEGSATTVGDRLDDIETDIAALSSVGGWNALATVPTRQSTDDPIFVLRFAADMTGILSPGMRIRCVQNSATIYLIIHLVGAYSGGNTDVTVYGGTNYDVLNTSTYPISNPFFSREKQPYGFPSDPELWELSFTDSTLRSASGTSSNTWYNPGSLSFDIFPGVWDFYYNVYAGRDASNSGHFKFTLSTANNSESDSKNTSGFYFSTGINHFQSLFKRITFDLTTKTTYYFNVLYTGTTSGMYLNNGVMPMVVKCRSAYL